MSVLGCNQHLYQQHLLVEHIKQQHGGHTRPAVVVATIATTAASADAVVARFRLDFLQFARLLAALWHLAASMSLLGFCNYLVLGSSSLPRQVTLYLAALACCALFPGLLRFLSPRLVHLAACRSLRAFCDYFVLGSAHFLCLLSPW